MPFSQLLHQSEQRSLRCTISSLPHGRVQRRVARDKNYMSTSFRKHAWYYCSGTASRCLEINIDNLIPLPFHHAR